MSANACKSDPHTLTQRVMSVWSYCHADVEYKMMDADTQGELAVQIYHRISVRGELVTRENCLRHLEAILED